MFCAIHDWIGKILGLAFVATAAGYGLWYAHGLYQEYRSHLPQEPQPMTLDTRTELQLPSVDIGEHQQEVWSSFSRQD